MKTYQFFVCLLCSCLFLINCKNKTDSDLTLSNAEGVSLDSLYSLVRYKNRKRTEKQLRLEEINKALFLVQTAHISDSTKQFLLNSLSLETTKRFKTSFIAINDLAITLATQSKDFESLGNLYWDRGYHYKNRDSTLKYYYKSKTSFQKANNIESMIKIQFRIASILTDVGAYKISNAYCFEILAFAKEHSITGIYSNTHNLIGINYKNLGQFEIARNYYKRSLKQTKNTELTSAAHNNIANVYLLENNNKDALKHFNLALEHLNISKERPLSLLKYSANKGYVLTKLNREKEGINLIENTLYSLDSLDDPRSKDIKATNLIRLSKNSISNRDTLTAIVHLNRAKEISKASKNHRDLLQSLILLAELDKKNGNTYFEEYRRIEDSINQANENSLSHFNRIRYETDEIIAENQLLSERMVLFLIIGILLLVLGFFVYYYLSQKTKNTKLKLEKEQQENSQEIYKLLLAQQYKIEEGKALEQKRISEELHDGVLGRLFGTRLSLGILNTSTSEDAEKQRKLFIEEIKNIEEEIRNLSHDLSHKFEKPDVDFVEFVHRYLKTNCDVANLQLYFNNDPEIDWIQVNGLVKINLYRIIQESNKNTIKHAKANEFHVTFSKKESYLSLMIKDNGTGFDYTRSKNGIGIKNIQNRVRKLNGSIEILSNLDNGTTFKINVLLKQTK